MSIATLIRRMTDAGAPPEAIALAVEEIEALQAALDARRHAERDRKRAQRERQKSANVTGQSGDSHGTVTDKGFPDKEIPQTPKEINPIPSPPFNPPASQKRGTRLANDFEPPEDWIAWAIKKRGWSRAEAIDECECFIRYWQAKPGREACKLDWPKTWQNWTVNSRRKPTQTAPPVWDGMA
jgi:hypothetical protein